MKARSAFVAGLLVAAAAGGLAALVGGSTRAADPPRAAAVEAGRYQLTHDRDGKPAYLFDTATGRVWQPWFADKVGEWREHIAPPKSK